MRIKDIFLIVLITIFIVGPAVLALSAYVLTKNPSLRPLGITVDSLAEAGQLAEKGLIVAVVDIGTHAPYELSKRDYEKALRTAFDRMNSDVRIRFRSVPNGETVSVTYIVGESRIGPFPASQAASGISLAVEAERLTVAQRKSAMLDEERRKQSERTGIWAWLMNE